MNSSALNEPLFNWGIVSSYWAFVADLLGEVLSVRDFRMGLGLVTPSLVKALICGGLGTSPGSFLSLMTGCGATTSLISSGIACLLNDLNLFDVTIDLGDFSIISRVSSAALGAVDLLTLVSLRFSFSLLSSSSV